ncbi:unnamed protein product, partial [Symbiodinium sp. KB8]
MIFCESHSRVKLSQALGEKINGMRISMAHAYLNVLAFMVLLLVIVSQRVVLLDVSSAVTYTFRWHLVFMLAVSTAHLIHPTWMLKTPMTCDFWYLLVMASVMAVALVPDPGAPDHACTKNIQRLHAVHGYRLPGCTLPCANTPAAQPTLVGILCQPRLCNLSPIHAPSLIGSIANGPGHFVVVEAILLRDRPGFSFEGTKFQDLVATSWEAREAALQLNRGDEAEEPIAQSFHTRLVDSCSSKFRTEVFHVKYCKLDGQTSHLVGLRDFTDQSSLRREPPAEVPVRDNSSNALVRDNSAPDFSSRGSATEEMSNMVLLSLDVEHMSVEAASAPATSLVGMDLVTLFPGPGAELLRDVWSKETCRFQAASSTPGRQELPPRVFTFVKMVVQWRSEIVDHIDGCVEAIRTDKGPIKLLMRCRGSLLTSSSSIRSSSLAQ